MRDKKESLYYLPILIVWSIAHINLTGFMYEDDEGAYLYISSAIVRGERLYSDVLAAKPPLLFYIGALIYKIFGNDLFTFRFFSSSLGLVASILIFEFFKARNDRFSGLILSLIFTLDPIVFTQMRFFRTDILMLTTFVSGAYFIFRSRDLKDIVISTLLFSLSVFSRDDAFVYSIFLVLYLLFKYKERRYLLVMIGVILSFVVSLMLRGEQQVIGSFSQQIDLSKVNTGERIERYKDFLLYLIKTYPVWLLFPLIIIPVIKFRRENMSLISFLLVVLNLAMIFFSNSTFIRYTMITIFARLLLLSDLMNVLKGKMRYVAAVGAIILQILLNPPPIGELFFNDKTVLKIANHLKSISNGRDVLLSDYGYFNFLSGMKGTSISGYISGGSVNSGEIDAERLIRIIQKEGVDYLLIHTDGRLYYPYGCEIYYYEPHHIKGMRNWGVFKEYIEKNFSLISTFYGIGPVFKLYKRITSYP